jgi:hypothetical protein
MPALHQREYPVRAVLHRQVKVIGEFRYLRIRLHEAVGKLDRVRRREADAVDAIHGGNVVDERREIGDRAVMHRTLVGIHILAKQVDFAHALFSQLYDLGDYVVERPADLLAARIRHDAETAVLAAAFHAGDERGLRVAREAGRTFQSRETIRR